MEEMNSRPHSVEHTLTSRWIRNVWLLAFSTVATAFALVALVLLVNGNLTQSSTTGVTPGAPLPVVQLLISHSLAALEGLAALSLVLVLVRVVAFIYSLNLRRSQRKADEDAYHVPAGPELHSDAPWSVINTDSTEYRDFVQVVADTIRRSAEKTPLAISIEAEWGMGKTFVMKWLSDELEAQHRNPFFWNGERWRFHVVWFNAWKYRGADAQRGLLSAIFDSMQGAPIVEVFGLASPGEVVGLGADIGGRAAHMGDIGELVSKRLDVAGRYRNRFETDFKKLLDLWRHVCAGERQSLVIMVDDLDRCLPEDIIRIMELIKLFFDTSGCIFVLGFDPVFVAKSIERQYREVLPDGAAYLKKLIQVNYALPQLSDASLQRFIENRIDDGGLTDFFTDLEAQLTATLNTNVADESQGQSASSQQTDAPSGEKYPLSRQMIIGGTARNPREIKRFLNAVALNLQLLKADRDKSHDTALALVLLFQIKWPAFYEALVRAARQDRLLQVCEDIEGFAARQQRSPAREYAQAERAMLSRMPWLRYYDDLLIFVNRYRLQPYVAAMTHLVTAHSLYTASAGTPEVDATQMQTVLVDVTQLAQGQPPSASTPNDLLSRPPMDLALLPSPENVVGREHELAWLAERLRSARGSEGRSAEFTGADAAIYGMGGIGKTVLVAEAARRAWQAGEFPDGIAAVQCAGMSEPSTALRRVLDRFYRARGDLGAQDLNHINDLVRDRLLGLRALVILDNVEPALGAVIDQVITPLRSAGIAVLLTSRQALPAQAIPAVAIRLLKPLSQDAALELFASAYKLRSAHELTDEELSAGSRIVAALNGHALAITLVAASAAMLGRPLEAVAAEIERNSLVALQADSGPGGIEQILESTFSALDSQAQTLYVMLAGFPTADIGRQALLSVARDFGITQSDEALNTVVRFGLLQPSLRDQLPVDDIGADRERLQAHPLVFADARMRFTQRPDGHRDRIQRSISLWYARYVADRSTEAIGADEGNVLGALNWAHDHGDDQTTATLCAYLSDFWRERSKTTATLDYAPWGIDAFGRLDPGRDGTAFDRGLLTNLKLTYAEALHLTGLMAEAQQYIEDCLLVARELGRVNLIVLALSLLGNIAFQQGDLSGAHDLYEQARDFSKQANDPRSEASLLAKLGQIARQRGDLEKAVTYLTQSRNLANETRDLLTEGAALNALGLIAQSRGRLNEAQDYYTQARDVARKTQNPQEEAVTLSRLGQLALWRGQLDRASSSFQESLSILINVQDKRGQAADYYNLGQIEQLRGNHDEARRQFERSRALNREIGDLRGEGITLIALGQIARDQRDMSSAERYFNDALRIRSQAQDRRGEGIALSNLGHVALESKQLDVAQAYLLRSLSIRRETQDRWGEGVDLELLGEVARQRGAHDDAQKYLTQSLQIRQEIQDLRGVGTVQYRMAQLAEGQAQTERAEALYRESLINAQESGNNQGQAEVQLALAQLLANDPDSSHQAEVTTLVKDALAGFQRLGLPQAHSVRIFAEQLGLSEHSING